LTCRKQGKQECFELGQGEEGDCLLHCLKMVGV
jgi:hypothetical protein